MNTTKKCPLCAEQIPLAAVTCEFCGAQFKVEVIDGQTVSKFIEEPILEPPPEPQSASTQEVRKTGGGLLLFGILAGVLLCAVVIGALLWFGWDKLSPSPGFVATVTPTLFPTTVPISTATPTVAPRPTIQSPPTTSPYPLAPSNMEAIRQCLNLGPPNKATANKYELTIVFTWKDNATNELGYIVYLYGTEIGRVDANVTRYAISKQSKYAIYLTDNYGVTAWNNAGESKKIEITVDFSCP